MDWSKVTLADVQKNAPGVLSEHTRALQEQLTAAQNKLKESEKRDAIRALATEYKVTLSPVRESALMTCADKDAQIALLKEFGAVTAAGTGAATVTAPVTEQVTSKPAQTVTTANTTTEKQLTESERSALDSTLKSAFSDGSIIRI